MPLPAVTQHVDEIYPQQPTFRVYDDLGVMQVEVTRSGVSIPRLAQVAEGPPGPPGPAGAGVVSVRDYGVVGDGATNDAPAFAALAPGQYFVPRDTYAWTTSVTIPDGVHLSMEEGARFLVGAGVRITFGSRSRFYGTWGQHFQYASTTSRVYFRQGSVDEVRAAWWGMVDGGTTYGTSALAVKRAIDAVLDPTPGATYRVAQAPVRLSVGHYGMGAGQPGVSTYDERIVISDCHGLVVVGPGSGLCEIRTYLDASSSAFTLRGCHHCRFEGFSVINVDNAFDCHAAFRVESHDSTHGGYISSACVWRDVRTGNIHTTRGQRWGWYFTPCTIGTYNDNNNEFHLLDGCGSEYYQEGGVYIEGSQAKHITLRKCSLNTNQTETQVGSAGKWGVKLVSGSFNFYDGNVAGSDQVDFLIANNTEICTIDGFDGENSRRLLDVGDGSLGNVFVLRNFRWESNRAAIDTTVAGYPVCYAIRLGGTGPYTIQGGVWGTRRGGIDNSNVLKPVIYYTGAGAGIIVQGVQFSSPGSSEMRPVRTSTGQTIDLVLQANLYTAVSGTGWTEHLTYANA